MQENQLSMLEVATKILTEHNDKMKMAELIKLTLEAKGLDLNNTDYATQLYLDITTSAKFVYMGEDEWDLKSRQSLKEYDKDGSDFINLEDIEEDDEEIIDHEEGLDLDDELDEDMYDEELEDEDNEDEDLDDSDDFEHDDEGHLLERYDEDEDFDEDKYNDYMDDFEDMYDN